MMLPESEIDADDYPKGLWGKARALPGGAKQQCDAKTTRTQAA